MVYWGNKADECDYAFDAISVNISLIKRRMFNDLDNVLDKSFPEQGIVASVSCIRKLGETYPKCLIVSFKKKDFQKAKGGYFKWYDLVKDKLPETRKEALKHEAEKEFKLMEDILYKKKGGDIDP